MSQSTTPPDPSDSVDALRLAVDLAQSQVNEAHANLDAAKTAKRAAETAVTIAEDNLRMLTEKLDRAERDSMICIRSMQQHFVHGPAPTRSTAVELLVDGIPFALIFDRNSNRGEVRVEAGGVVQVFSSSSLAVNDEAS